MKLIFCPECSDVVKLRLEKPRTCDCGKSWGWYDDNINATIGGKAIPIGFANNSFVDALRNRPKDGLGSEFVAFVIPHEAGSIKKSKLKNCPK